MNLYQSLRDFFKDIKLVYKFSFAFFLVALITLVAIGLFSFYQGQNLLSEKAFEVLENVTRHKKEGIEDYFDNINSQLLTLAKNPSTVDALKAFSEGYQAQAPLTSQEEKQKLEKFYELDFIKVLQYNQVSNLSNRSYLPAQPQAQTLQYKYLANNPHPIGYKQMLHTSGQTDSYDQAHSQYHESFIKYINEMPIDDIMLIDMEGNVVYTVLKRTDFATNFLKEPYKNSPSARLYRRLKKRTIFSKNEEITDFEDYDFYEPNYFHPSAFIGIALYDNTTGSQNRIGVLIFQISDQKIQQILTNRQDWETDGLGQTGESALIGPDFLIRNNTRGFLSDPLTYTQDLLDSKVDTLVVQQIQRLKTTILLREYKIEGSIQAIENGKSGSQTRTDFKGNEVLDVFANIDIMGTRWAIITEIDAEEIFKAVGDLRFNLLTIVLVVSIVIGVLGYSLARTLTKPMVKIGKDISMLAQGTFPKPSSRIYKDELGEIDAALNRLISNMQEVAFFAENVGEGRFETPFEVNSQQDALRNALLKMRDNLKKASDDEKIRSWMSTGSALLSEVLRKNADSLQHLAEACIAELVTYVGANQGAFFIWNEVQEVLNIGAAFAYNKKKYLNIAIKAGEGLIGQTYLERQTVYLSEIPEGYTNIHSGLGRAAPSCLLIVPIQTAEKVLGVLEMASFYRLKQYQIEFVETIAENIATTMQSIHINEGTKRLLIESQQATELMKRQEEEMRSSFEDLITSQEEVRKRQQQLDELLMKQLLREKPESQQQTKPNFESKFDLSNSGFSQKISEAIERQKKILDQAWENNKTQEENLKNKVVKSDQTTDYDENHLS